jgi:hypothetical protein
MAQEEKKLMWQQTPEGRARMKKIMLARAKQGLLWNQSPAGRKKVSAIMRKRKRPNTDGVLNAESRPQARNSASDLGEAQVAYALGHIQSWIETYARSAGLPSATLAHRLGALLLRSSRR